MLATESKNEQILEVYRGEISCITSKAALHYVRKKGGIEAVGQVLQLSDVSKGESELCEETNWVSYEEMCRIFEAAGTVLGDAQVGRNVGRDSLLVASAAAETILCSDHCSPRQAFRDIPVLYKKLSRISKMELVKLGPYHVRLHHILQPGSIPNSLGCEYTAGMLESVPRLFGAPYARVRHKHMRTAGNSYHCEFEVIWSEPWAWILGLLGSCFLTGGLVHIINNGFDLNFLRLIIPILLLSIVLLTSFQNKLSKMIIQEQVWDLAAAYQNLFEKHAQTQTVAQALDKANQQVLYQSHRLEQLLVRIVDAQETERRRIAADIHDWISQGLVGPQYRVEMAKRMLSAFPDAAVTELEALERDLAEAHREIRRIMEDLHPYLLDELGFDKALQIYCERFQSATGIACCFNNYLGGQNLTSAREMALFRITQEALNNVAQHANAKMVSVTLRIEQGNILLIITDNGRGFNPSTSVQRGCHFGLLGMKDRTEMLGGTVEVISSLGVGTTIKIQVPGS